MDAQRELEKADVAMRRVGKCCSGYKKNSGCGTNLN
jgi:hypothetical protein